MPDPAIHVLYFAWLRERTGRSEEILTPPPGITTVGDLVTWLGQQSPGHAAALTERSVRCAVNQDFADQDTPVKPGDEVAFFPPVTGG
jgi:molybdopterin synthase sulfur carrier subunit